MSLFLRRFKVIQCPYEGDIIRAQSFERHMKEQHRRELQWHKHMKEAMRNEACLICQKGSFHTSARVGAFSPARRGNEYFINVHKQCFKNTRLTESEKELCRKKIANSRVDLDEETTQVQLIHDKDDKSRENTDEGATQHKDSIIHLPTRREETGPVQIISDDDDDTESQENTDEVGTQSPTRKEDVISVLTPISLWPRIEVSPHSSATLLPERDYDFNEKVIPALFLDDEETNNLDTENANLLNRVYNHIFEAGRQYPFSEQGVQAVPSQKDEAVITDHMLEHEDKGTGMSHLFHEDQATQMPHVNYREQGTGMPQTQLQEKSVNTNENETGDNPILNLTLTELEEANQLKNTMIAQLLHDNVELLQTRINMRRQALATLEEAFNIPEQDYNENVNIKLSKILQIKDRLINRILHETAAIHPQIRRVLNLFS